MSLRRSLFRPLRLPRYSGCSIEHKAAATPYSSPTRSTTLFCVEISVSAGCSSHGISPRCISLTSLCLQRIAEWALAHSCCKVCASKPARSNWMSRSPSESITLLNGFTRAWVSPSREAMVTASPCIGRESQTARAAPSSDANLLADLFGGCVSLPAASFLSQLGSLCRAVSYPYDRDAGRALCT